VSELTPDQAYSQFKQKVQDSLVSALSYLKAIRQRYQQIASAILSVAAANIESMMAEQKTVHKDISYFKNYTALQEKRPPLPQFTYQGPTMEIAGRTLPSIPMFIFQAPAIDPETASLSVLASLFYLVMEKNFPIAGDYENAFAKYYSFDTVAVGGPGEVSLPASVTVSDWSGPKLLLFSQGSVIRHSSVVSVRRRIDTHLDAFVNIYNGMVEVGEDYPGSGLPPRQSTVQVIYAFFQVFLRSTEAQNNYRSIRFMNNACRGNATAAGETTIYTGFYLILRNIGPSGRVICQGV